MKRKILSLALSLVLLLGIITPAVAAEQPDEEELVRVLVNVYSNRTGTEALMGLYYDNIFYLPASDIAAMTGAELTKADKESVTFTMYDGLREILVSKDGTVTEEYGKLKQVCHLSAVVFEDKLYISAPDMLTYMGATVGFGEDETAELHMMVTMPYTVHDLLLEYLENSGFYFSWAEADGEYIDPESVKELAALDTIVLGYDSNIMAYGLWGYTEHLEKTIHADALLELLRTEGMELVKAEDLSVEILSYLDSNTEVSLPWLEKTMEWAAESDVDKKLASTFSEYLTAAGVAVDMTAGCISSMETAKQFANLSTTQKVLLQRTLCRVTEGSALYNQYPLMFEAARDAQALMTGEYTANEKAAWDSMYNIMSNAVDAIIPPNPVSMAWDTLTSIAKLDPLVGSILEAEANITFACECMDVWVLASGLIDTDADKIHMNNGCLGSKDTTLLENLKYDIILSLKAALTTRLLLLETGWLTEEAQSAMKAKATMTAELLNKAQNARPVPVGIWDLNEEDISWIEKLECAGEYGDVVSYGGYVYYWRYNDESFSETGCTAFYKTGVRNTMVRRGSEGKTEVLFSLNGKGKFVVANGHIFYQNNDAEICSISLDQTKKKNYGSGYLRDVTEDGRYVIYSTYTGDNQLRIIDVTDGTTRRLSYADSFVAYHDGVIYFTKEVDYELGQAGKVDLWCIRPDGTKMTHLYTTKADLYEHYAGYSSASVDHIRFTEEYIYFSYGSLAGTGVMFQGGRVIRIRYDGTGAEVMAGKNDLIFGPFYVNSDGSVTASGQNSVHYDMGCLTEVSSGEAYLYKLTAGSPERIITTRDYGAVGPGLLDQKADGSILLLDFVEVCDGKAYYIVHYAVDNTEEWTNWRDENRRMKTVMFEKDLKTGRVTILFQF